MSEKIGFAICRRVLLTWNAVVVEELTRKRLVADDMHCYFLVKRCFADWKKVYLFAVTVIQFPACVSNVFKLH